MFRNCMSNRGALGITAVCLLKFPVYVCLSVYLFIYLLITVSIHPSNAAST